MLPSSLAPSQRRVAAVGLVAILAVACWLRATHLSFGLPYLRHPDEGRYVKIAHRIYRSGDLNPQFFRIPSLLLYANASVYAPCELLRRAAGNPAPLASPDVLAAGVGYAPHPVMFLAGRSVTLAAGLGAVLTAFLLGKAVGGRTAGLATAALTAISPTAVAHGRLITPDTFVMLFAALACLASVHILKRGATRYYVGAAVAVGLVVSSKYNGFFFALCPLAAHLLRRRQGTCRGFAWMVLLPVLSGAVFLTVCPYALLDYPRFTADLMAEARHYATGHPGMEGGHLGWYWSALLRALGPAALLSVVGVAAAAHMRDRKAMLVGGVGVAYVLFVSLFNVRNERTLAPAIPLMACLAGWLLVRLWQSGATLSGRAQRWFGLAVGVLALGLTIPPLVGALQGNAALGAPDPRVPATAWCNRNLPRGARMAVEAYSIYPDPRRFLVDGYFTVVDKPVSWYRDRGYEYLVVSSGAYRRYLRSPSRYPEESRRYRTIFGELPLVASFAQGSPEIRIYRVTFSDVHPQPESQT
jgi:4-amino-4-deoxy-L-arabinose transferase-like glycosyltransferase